MRRISACATSRTWHPSVVFDRTTLLHRGDMILGSFEVEIDFDKSYQSDQGNDSFQEPEHTKVPPS